MAAKPETVELTKAERVLLIHVVEALYHEPPPSELFNEVVAPVIKNRGAVLNRIARKLRAAPGIRRWGTP